MFTGIITDTGHITRQGEKQNGVVLTISSTYSDLELGESVAVNGACLTVASFAKNSGAPEFFVSPETLKLTNLGDAQLNTRVNLERALKADARLSGHIVQGHVDGLASVTSIQEIKGEQPCYELSFDLPANLARHCVSKGSITIDGVSLTVNAVVGSSVTVMIIPHTWMHTRFSDFKTGTRVNIETDIVAKYVEKLCTPYLK